MAAEHNGLLARAVPVDATQATSNGSGGTGQIRLPGHLV
jgi:hypothetical protein